MRKGISPIVAIVLLIAVAVIGSAAMYFFAGGVATKNPALVTPTSLSITSIGNAQFLVANLGQSPFNVSDLVTSNANISVVCSGIVEPGEQTICSLDAVPDEEISYNYNAAL